MKFILVVTLFMTSVIELAYSKESVKEEINLFGGKTSIRNIEELRDPFRRTPPPKGSAKRNRTEPRSNFVQNVKSIENFPLSSIRIVGVLLGEERRAVARIATESANNFSGESLSADEQLGKESYLLKEGMRIGENKAEIKAILPGGIVLVEKIRNVYDQDEYLETIIPVSQ